jgi:hypothetical protein
MQRGKPKAERDSVFLNIPYDNSFQDLYIAYVVGLVELGLTPKATLAIPGGTARLERIFKLIKACRYSVHDLSRVELDKKPPATPRFNMPFELGAATMWSNLNPGTHIWFVFESVNRRAQKSISDMNGSDFNIHNGTPSGVMRELCNAFIRQNQPGVPQMVQSYQQVKRLLPALQRQSGAQSPFEARMFEKIVTTAARLREAR